jgi:hypothetical protein
MNHKLSKGKSSTKRRPAAKRSCAKRPKEAEVALGTLIALLHADRWLFEAAELAKKGRLDDEIEEFNAIRLSIVNSLNRLQPRAYGAMSRSALLDP